MKRGRAKQARLWVGPALPVKASFVSEIFTRGLLCAGLFCVLPKFQSSARASDIDSVAAYYADDSRTVLMAAARGTYTTRDLWTGRGRESALTLGYTGKLIEQSESNSLVDDAVGRKITDYSENSLTVSADQGLTVGSVVGLLAGTTNSPLGRTYYYGLRGGQWFLSETIQTTLEIRKTVSRVPVLDFTDTDGKRIVTPADLDGTSVSASVTNFTTPTTILMASLSRSLRTDRPPADAIAAEIRQFLPWTKSAVHLGLAHYENVGRIAPITQVGSVVSNTMRVEWHQRLPMRMIVMGGYRYHIETETPRASDAATTQIGSDSIYGSWRWRMGRGAWTANRHEVYSFVARYTTNAEGLAYVVGVGGKYFL